MEFRKIEYDSLNDNYYLKIKNKEYLIKHTNSVSEIIVLNALKHHRFYHAPLILDKFIYNDNNYILLKYIKGEVPKTLQKCDFIKLAKIVSHLHKAKIDYNLLGEENDESISKLKFYYNHIKDNLTEAENSIVHNFLNQSDANSFSKLNLPKSIIHSDIKTDNMLKNNSKIYLIDYGNCYYGYRIIDLIRLYMWLILKSNLNPELYNSFLKTYNKRNKINENECNNSNFLYKFCLIYNFCKDTYYYMTGKISNNYYYNTSKKWLSYIDYNFNLKELLYATKNR